jgi:hypothetical protein
MVAVGWRFTADWLIREEIWISGGLLFQGLDLDARVE